MMMCDTAVKVAWRMHDSLFALIKGQNNMYRTHRGSNENTWPHTKNKPLYNGGNRLIHCACLLCKNSNQTNKHVLSNCGSSTFLDRYRKVSWCDRCLRFWRNVGITNHIQANREIFVDLQIEQFKPLSKFFLTLRLELLRYWTQESTHWNWRYMSRLKRN